MKTTDCDLCRQGVLAVLSHELRNPMAALSNSLYVLRKSQPGEERALRAMAVMERQIRQLTGLIEGLTDAAMLELGKVKLRLSQVDLCELLRDVGHDHETLFANREVEFCVCIPPPPIHVLADPTRLVQIMANLLQNAADFTPARGRVTLTLENPNDTRSVRISVRDSGIGLDAKFCDRLFKPFAQADTSLAHSKGGLGLGLTMVKGLVELHSGRVSAQSGGPGHGSTFIVDLPLSS